MKAVHNMGQTALEQRKACAHLVKNGSDYVQFASFQSSGREQTVAFERQRLRIFTQREELQAKSEVKIQSGIERIEAAVSPPQK